MSLDLGTNRTYTANSLNQYTNIVEGAGGFLPQFDDDGNQTLIKTATGVWQVSYNGENRPVSWTCGATNIVMKFDRMGRRVEYIEMVSDVINAHHRFVYDGYLCVQRLNGAANNSIDLVFGWDPSEPIATRPLVLQKYGEYNLFYTHDGNKNVSELVFFQQANGIAAHYEYAPFGAVTAATTNTAFTAFNVASVNPYRFSSEYVDDVLGLVCYGHRYYNSITGRWINRDCLEENGGVNLYCAMQNNSICLVDIRGDIPLDTIWDIANIIYDICVGDKVALAADTAALMIPYLPAGTTKLVKTARLTSVEKICPSAKQLQVTYEYLPARLYNGGKHTLPVSAARNQSWIKITKKGPAK